MSESELFEEAERLWYNYKFEEAIPYFLRLIKMNCRQHKYYYGLAYCYHFTNKYDEADKHYKKKKN